MKLTIKNIIKLIAENMKKLTAKNVLFILMCVLLVLTVIMALITLGRVGNLLQSGENPNMNVPQDTNSSSSTAPDGSDASSKPIITEPGHEHEYVKTNTYRPNCLSSGYSLYECSCGKTTIQDFIDPYGHKYSEPTVIEATCTTDGWTERKCSRCNNVEKTNIIAASHNYSEWVSDTDTTEQRFCDACAITEIRSLDTANTWVLQLTEQKAQDGFAHYRIVVALANSTNDLTYDIYTELTENLYFDYVNNTLCISYAAGSAYSVPAGVDVVTFYADGTVANALPVLTPETDTDTEDPNPDIGGEDPGNEDPGNEEPGNEEPGNEEPGNEEPGNEEPGNEEPGNEEPGNEEPGNEEPGNEDPGNEEPGNEEPGNEEPGNEEPGNEEPGNEEPGNEEPGNEEPGNEEPGNEEPGSDEVISE